MPSIVGICARFYTCIITVQVASKNVLVLVLVQYCQNVTLDRPGFVLGQYQRPPIPVYFFSRISHTLLQSHITSHSFIEYLRNTKHNLGGKTNDTAGGSRASVSGLERVGMATLSKIVLTTVDNDGSANNGVVTSQLEKRVLENTLGNTLRVSLDVSEVTNVSLRVGGTTVVLLEGVEVGAGRSAAVGVVTKLVDVESSLSVGIVALDVVGDSDGAGLRVLLESDSTGDLGISSKNSDWVRMCSVGKWRTTTWTIP